MSLPFSWEKLGKWSRALALAAGMGLAGTALEAQETPRPVPGNGGSKYVVKNTTFHLPFKMDRANAAQVREMHLWMRDAAGQWRLVDRVAPTANYFTCRVPRDGDYGFSIVTIDPRGIPAPVDVTRRPPELHVIVETHTGSTQTGSTYMASTYAGSTPTRGTMTPAIIPASAPAVSDTVILNDTAPAPLAPTVTAPKAVKTTIPEIQATEQTLEIPSEPAAPPPLVKTPAKSSRPVPVPPAAIPESLVPEEIQQEDSKLSSADTPASAAQPVVLLVNKKHVSIEYNVNKTGPSGLSKVLIYGTADQGKTWRRFGEDSDRQSPADIDLPGEGVYGIRIVGFNGNGFGAKAPAAGDRPATTIEVDATKPRIDGWKVSLVKNGQLEIRWKVTDKNLGSEPITLFYSTRRNGPWKPLATKVKNDGCYHWSIARDLAPQYYIRLEATDAAGNVAACETQTPVLVDRTPPEINVTGVSIIRSTTVTESLVPVGEPEEE